MQAIRRKAVWLQCVLWWLMPMLASAAWAEVPIPPLQAHLNDSIHLLDPARAAAIEARLVEVDQHKHVELVVLIVDSTQEESIEAFARRAFLAWKTPRTTVQDVVLLAIAKSDRRMRIEVDYGLARQIPDATAQQILDNIVRPKFRAEDFAGGVDAAVDALIKSIDGEPLPDPSAKGSSINLSEVPWWDPILIFVTAMFSVFSGLALAIGLLWVPKPKRRYIVAGINGLLFLWLLPGLGVLAAGAIGYGLGSVIGIEKYRLSKSGGGRRRRWRNSGDNDNDDIATTTASTSWFASDMASGSGSSSSSSSDSSSSSSSDSGSSSSGGASSDW